MTSSFFTKSWTSKRLVQTGSKSSLTSQASGIGHLRQMDEKSQQLNAIQIGEGYILMVEGGADIVVTDRITVDGQDYDVQGIKRETLGSIDVKQCVLTRKKG